MFAAFLPGQEEATEAQAGMTELAVSACPTLTPFSPCSAKLPHLQKAAAQFSRLSIQDQAQGRETRNRGEETFFFLVHGKSGFSIMQGTFLCRCRCRPLHDEDDSSAWSGGGGGIPSHSYPVSAPSSQQFRRGLGGTCEEGGKPGFKPCLACRCRHHPGIRQQRRKRTSLHQTCPMLLWLAEEQVEKAEEGLFAGSVPAVPFPPFSRHFLRERQKMFREPGLPKAEKVGGGVGWWAKFSSYAASATIVP